MNGYYGYIRVSTTKQSDGVSLQEQRAVIEAFCATNALTISEWFEEQETAAKKGRTTFNRMVADVEKGRAAGIVIHKVDRGARNYGDWAQLGELIDRGIDIRFAHDNLDLSTRGGRLTADLLAVLAVDYVRNLKEEVRKGQLGRLKQGIWPFSAPRGYQNQGKGKLKTIDPIVGPLVRQAFELYGTCRYGLHELRSEMASRGLRGASGNPLALEAMSHTLRNPFYIGVLSVPSFNQVFEGKHEPLVSRQLFKRVQDILSGRLYPRVQIHRFLFRRLIKCGRCGRSLTGERKKGNVYYRCHDYGCPGVSVRESAIDQFVRLELAHLSLSSTETGDFRELMRMRIEQEDKDAGKRKATIERDLALVQARLDRLTDAMIEGVIDRGDFEPRKAALIDQRRDLLDASQHEPHSTFWETMAERFELGIAALQGYEKGDDADKREIVEKIGSNLRLDGKQPVFPMLSPFAEMREWSISTDCAHRRRSVRTLFDRLRSRDAFQSIEKSFRSAQKREPN